jgi:hypothetical protein
LFANSAEAIKRVSVYLFDRRFSMNKRKVLIFGLMGLMLLCLATIAYASIAQAAQKCENPPCSANAQGQGPKKSPKADVPAAQPQSSPEPNGNKSNKDGDKQVGQSKPPEEDWKSGGGDDSASDGNPSDTDKRNSDDSHSNGPNGPAPNAVAAARANCDNNGFDCFLVITPATFTPSPSPSATATPTSTSTPTFTPSPTASPTATATEVKGGKKGGGGGGSEGPPAPCQIERFGMDNGSEIQMWPVTRPDGVPVFGSVITVTLNLEGDQLNPSLDPSGRTCLQMVFEDHGSGKSVIKTANWDGTNVQSLDYVGSDPAFGWDGSRYITFTGSYANIFRVNPDGSGLEPLGVSGLNSQPSPSGKWILYEPGNGHAGVVWSRGPVGAMQEEMANYHFQSTWSCENFSWDPTGEVICEDDGLRYIIDASGTFIPVYPTGREGLMDPTGNTMHGVIGTADDTCLVPNFLGVNNTSSLSSVGSCIGKGQNFTWVKVPGQLHPEDDGWMQGFLYPESLPKLSPSPTPTP